jgi:SAM-dependent methyltransferase
MRAHTQGASLRKLLSRKRIKTLLNMIGFDTTHWVRIEAYREAQKWIAELGPERLDVLEIAPGDQWRRMGFRSYKEVWFPEFDVCEDILDRKFDLIIADQVFEHVRFPWRAARNVRQMLRPGGHFLIIVPFMLKVHDYPDDCTRWTASGLRYLLEDAGFPASSIKTGSWGNRDCIKQNLRRGWRMYGWGRSLRNEPEFPIMSWALAGPVAATAAPAGSGNGEALRSSRGLGVPA